MDELTRFIKVNNHEAVNIGDLEEHSVARHESEPKFSVDCPELAVREGVEELTLRRAEEGMLRTFIDGEG